MYKEVTKFCIGDVLRWLAYGELYRTAEVLDTTKNNLFLRNTATKREYWIRKSTMIRKLHRPYNLTITRAKKNEEKTNS